MNKKTYKDLPPIIGVSSMLSLFLIICLIVFACLSLSSAMNDYNFSEKAANNKTAYYNACNEIETEIAELVASGTANGSSKTWSVAIDDNRTLDVTVNFHAGGYDVKQWQTINHAKDSESTMNLIRIDE